VLGSQKDIVRLSGGLDYALKLKSNVENNLHILAGYIHDPQIYRSWQGNRVANDYFTFGLGLELKKFQLGVSARLPLAAVDEQELIYSSRFQFGIGLIL